MEEAIEIIEKKLKILVCESRATFMGLAYYDRLKIEITLLEDLLTELKRRINE